MSYPHYDNEINMNYNQDKNDIDDIDSEVPNDYDRRNDIDDEYNENYGCAYDQVNQDYNDHHMNINSNTQTNNNYTDSDYPTTNHVYISKNNSSHKNIFQRKKNENKLMKPSLVDSPESYTKPDITKPKNRNQVLNNFNSSKHSSESLPIENYYSNTKISSPSPHVDNISNSKLSNQAYSVYNKNASKLDKASISNTLPASNNYYKKSTGTSLSKQYKPFSTNNSNINVQTTNPIISNNNTIPEILNNSGFSNPIFDVNHYSHYQAVNSMLEAKVKECSEKDKSIGRLEKQVESFKTKLYEKRIELEKAKLDLELGKKKIDEYEKIKEMKSDEVSKIQSLLNTKEIGLAEIENLVKTTESKFKLLEERNIVLENENLELKRHIMQSKEIILKNQMKCEQFEAKEKNLLGIIDKLNNDIQNIHASQKDKLSDEYEATSKMFKKREEELKKFFNEEIEKINGVVEEKKREIEKLKLFVQEKEYSSKLFEERKSTLEGEIKSLNEKLSKEKEKTKRLSEEFQGLVKEVEEQLQEKDRVISQNIETFEKEEKELSSKIIELEKELILIKEENSRFNRQTDNLTDKHKDYISKLEEKDEKIRQLKLQNEKLSNEMNRKRTDLSYTKESIEKDNKRRSDEVKRLMAEKNELMNLNAEMRNNLEYAEEQIKSINDAVINYQNQIDEENRIKTTIAVENQQLKTKIGELQNVIKNLNTELFYLNNNSNNLKSKYNSKIEQVSIWNLYVA